MKRAMKRAMVCGLVWISTFGCNDRSIEEPVDLGVRSGARLRVRSFVAEGGAAAFGSTVDTELDVECGFATADDGSTRCLPFQQPVFYRDADCQEPVFVMTPEHLACTRYAFDISPVACGEASRVTTYRITDEVLDVDVVYDRFSRGECLPAAIEGEVRAVERLDPAVFVGASIVDEPRADGLLMRRYAGDDGSRFYGEVMNARRDARCQYRFREPGEGRCEPTDVAIVGLPNEEYADADCEIPVGRAFFGDGCEPDAVSMNGEYFEVGDPVDATWTRNDDACVAYGMSGFPPGDGYQRGAPIPEASFPRVDEHWSGNGEVELRYYTDVDGALLWTPNTLVDTDSGSPCHIAKDREGTWRCVPAGQTSIAEVYADPQCRTPLLSNRASVRGAKVDYGACGPRLLSLHERGARHTEGGVWRNDDDRCERISDEPWPDHYVGRELEPSVLPALTEVVE